MNYIAAPRGFFDSDPVRTVTMESVAGVSRLVGSQCTRTDVISTFMNCI
jgi:hypothetical protein